MDTAEILDKAADLIQERSWFASGRGVMYSDARHKEQHYCAAVAIDVVSEDFFDLRAYTVFADFLGLNRDHPYDVTSAIFRWNDAQECKEDVIEALRSCAEKERIKAVEGVRSDALR